MNEYAWSNSSCCVWSNSGFVCKLTKAILLEAAQKQAALSFCSTEVALARAEARDLDLATVEASCPEGILQEITHSNL